MRDEEEKDWQVELGADKLKTMIDKGLGKPGCSNENGHQINKKHFVEFKNLGSVWPKDKRSDEKKKVKKPTDDLGVNRGGFRPFGHDVSLTLN